MYRAVILCTALLCNSVLAHEMTPTYPQWRPAYLPDLLKTQIEIFNKRKDVEWYEIGVFDQDWKAVPFVSSYRILRLKHLGHAKFDIYIRANDVGRAEYVCSKSKLIGTNGAAPLISSRICSRFK